MDGVFFREVDKRSGFFALGLDHGFGHLPRVSRGPLASISLLVASATNDFSRAFQRADAAGGIIASRQRRLKSTGPFDSSVADATPFSRGARDRALKRTAKFRRRHATAERVRISLLAYARPKR